MYSQDKRTGCDLSKPVDLFQENIQNNIGLRFLNQIKNFKSPKSNQIM